MQKSYKVNGMQSIFHMKVTERAKNRIINLGLVYDIAFLVTDGFIGATIFSVALTPLGWTRNAIMACIVFAIACPIDITLLYKKRTFWTWLTAFSMPIALLLSVTASWMNLSRVLEHRVFFAASGYVAASLVSKLIYKWLKRHDQN